MLSSVSRRAFGLLLGIALCGTLCDVKAQETDVGKVTITKTEPGAGAGTIVVHYTYTNVKGAASIKLFPTSPAGAMGGAPFPIGKSPASQMFQTNVFSQMISFELQILDKSGKVIVKTTGSGMTK